MVAFHLDNTFFYDPKIFTWENMCHHVEQMFLSDTFFGCEICTQPSYSATQKIKN